MMPRGRGRSELAGSDLRVGELCVRAGRSQSLVAYHLRQLREGECSAGSRPTPLHAAAVRAMRERGLDISGQRSTHLSELFRPAGA